MGKLVDILEKKYEAGIKWKNACAVHHRYDKGADAKLKRIMADIAANQSPPSYRKKWDRDHLRDAAQASDEWKKYLKEWNDAYKEMLDAINERDNWNSAFEAARTEAVNERELGKIK